MREPSGQEQPSAYAVSVTQQFNTSTSMGRLTLNVLLSSAQFECEVAGKRIRDKIALSKRRGMWMGGLPPLGYDGVDRNLVVNGPEAETIWLIYRRYLEVGSIAALKRSLDADGIVSNRRTYQDGRTAGGNPISRCAQYQILRNRIYRGEIAIGARFIPAITTPWWTGSLEQSSSASRHRTLRSSV